MVEFRIRLAAAAACVLAVASTSLAAQEAASTSGYRVVVEPLSGGATRSRAALARNAAQLVRRGLQARGQTVVSAAKLEELRQRNQAMEAELGDPLTEAQKLLELADADVVVQVGVRNDREKIQQGRYRVADTVMAMITMVDEATFVLDEENTANGLSLESFAMAHDAALTAALGEVSADGSLLAQIADALVSRRAREAERGVEFTLAVHSDLPAEIGPVFRASDFFAIAGVDKDSVDLNSETARRQVYQLRFKGRRFALREGVAAAVASKRKAIYERTSRTLTHTVMMARATVDVTLRLSEPEEQPLDKVLGDAMQRIVEPMYQNSPNWFDDTKPRFQPAFLPGATGKWNELVSFANSYWNAHTARAKELGDDGGDPLDAPGSVEIDGKPYKSLRDAKQEADRRAKDYYASGPGQKAMQIARFAESAFRKVSEGKVNGQVDDEVQSSILYTIKTEAALFRDEGAVDDSSIAWFTRQGADRLVVTRLVKPFDLFRLDVTVVDLAGGPPQSNSTELDPLYTEELTRLVNGEG
ncbi:MAG: hypothetical protein AAF628_05550 [Planctomycetota bacterium]